MKPNQDHPIGAGEVIGHRASPTHRPESPQPRRANRDGDPVDKIADAEIALEDLAAKDEESRHRTNLAELSRHLRAYQRHTDTLMARIDHLETALERANHEHAHHHGKIANHLATLNDHRGRLAEIEARLDGESRSHFHRNSIERVAEKLGDLEHQFRNLCACG